MWTLSYAIVRDQIYKEIQLLNEQIYKTQSETQRQQEVIRTRKEKLMSIELRFSEKKKNESVLMTTQDEIITLESNLKVCSSSYLHQ
jgi:hypothetical protein